MCFQAWNRPTDYFSTHCKLVKVSSGPDIRSSVIGYGLWVLSMLVAPHLSPRTHYPLLHILISLSSLLPDV